MNEDIFVAAGAPPLKASPQSSSGNQPPDHSSKNPLNRSDGRQQLHNGNAADSNPPLPEGSQRALKKLSSQSSFALGHITSTSAGHLNSNASAKSESGVVLSSGGEAASADTEQLHRARIQVYGANVLPPVKTKSILELMWLALHDKTLVTNLLRRLFLVFHCVSYQITPNDP